MDRIWKIAVILAAVFIVTFFAPHYLTWFEFAKLKKINAGKMPEAIVRFADDITCQLGEKTITFAYADLVIPE